MKKKLLALLLSVAMVFSLTGCVGNFYNRVMTVNGVDITPGMYLMMLMQAYTAAETQVENRLNEEAQAAAEEAGEEEVVNAPTIDDVNLLKQKIDGQGATAWIRAKAEEYCRRYVAVQQLAAEYDVKLGDDAWSEMENTFSYWTYFEDYYVENGVSYDTWRYQIENSYMEDALFTTLYGEDGEMAHPVEDTKAAYAEEYFHVRYFTIPVSAAAPEGEEEAPDVKAEATALVDEMLAALEGGAQFEDVAAEYLPQVYTLENRDFEVENAADYVYTSYIDFASEYYDEEWLAEMKTASTGTMGIRDNGNDYLMLYEKIEMFEDDEHWEAQESTVLSHLYGDEFEEWLTAIYEAYDVSKAFGAEWYYSPKKIK